MEKHITTPITQKITKDLRSGDYVYITGEMYVARDAAHKRMIEALDRKEELPIDIKDSTIYYMGPSPARDGRPIGSAGPTTATRMDKYAPRLLDLGEKAMIGKGKRSKEVIDAVIRNKAVYFAAVGGAGALLSKCIKSSEVICYDDLGAEAIRKIYVEDFPVIVVIDSEGNNLYETSIKEFKNVKIVGTTNADPKSGNLDLAALSRFGNLFEVELPTRKEIIASLKWHLKDCEAAKKGLLNNKNEREIEKFADELLKKHFSQRDVEKLAENAQTRFAIDIAKKSNPMEQKFDIKYLKEALKNKEFTTGSMNKKDKTPKGTSFQDLTFIQKLFLLFSKKS